MTTHAWRTGESHAAMRAAAARTAQKAHAEAQEFADWRKPTGNTQPVIRVGRGELTCLGCGETFGGISPINGQPTACEHCGGRNGVPTVSYLRSGEYTLVQ